MWSYDDSDEDTHTDSPSESDSESDCSSPPSPPHGVKQKLPTRVQANVLFLTVKKHIYRSLFSVDAMPPTEDEQDAVVWNAIESASEEILGYSLDPRLAKKFYKRCKPTMAATWSAFRNTAGITTICAFDLFNLNPLDIGGGLDIGGDLVPHIRNRIEDIFAGDDEFSALHKHDDDTGTTLYFEHKCIQNVITVTVWKNLCCGDVLQPESMSPLISLVAACLIQALQSRKSGFLPTKPARATNEEIAEVYRRVQAYMNTVVLGNPPARDRFIDFCRSLVARDISFFGRQACTEEDDDGF